MIRYYCSFLLSFVLKYGVDVVDANLLFHNRHTHHDHSNTTTTDTTNSHTNDTPGFNKTELMIRFNLTHAKAGQDAVDEALNFFN